MLRLYCIFIFSSVPNKAHNSGTLSPPDRKGGVEGMKGEWLFYGGERDVNPLGRQSGGCWAEEGLHDSGIQTPNKRRLAIIKDPCRYTFIKGQITRHVVHEQSEYIQASGDRARTLYHPNLCFKCILSSSSSHPHLPTSSAN